MPQAVMQDLSQGLFAEGGDGINFIVDSGASITLTFGARTLLKALLNQDSSCNGHWTC